MKEQLAIRIDKAVRERIEALAKSQRRTFSDMLRILLEDALIMAARREKKGVA